MMNIPQEFVAADSDPARPGNVYQANYIVAGARPGLHTAYLQNQQYLVMPQGVMAPAQHMMHPGVQMVPQMNMPVVCSPMVDMGLQTGSAIHQGAPAAVYQPRQVYTTAGAHQQQQHTRSRHGYASNMWAAVHGVGSTNHVAAAVGQATPVEDILQLLRGLPRGTSAIPVVADSLRYLDSRALAALLKELSKTGLREVAFEIFDWLRSLNEQMHPEFAGLLDVFTYTTMIAQCTNHMHLPTALELVYEMRQRNVSPNTHTYSSMLNVCVKAGELDLALDVFNQMLQEGLQPNLVTYNTLLEVYAKRGMWGKAVGVLDTLEQQRLVPEPRTFNIVMNACNAAGQFASCIAVHGRMASQKVPPTVGTYNAVILAHCKLDQLSAAQQLFNEMQQQGCQPTHTTFITLLQSAESHSQAAAAVSLLEQMQVLSLRLTPQCYAAAIGACASAGQLATARKLLGDMLASSKAGMAAPAHIIMQLQDKCCDWQGAYRTYQKLLASGVRPDSQTTATAIEALWGAGNVSSCLLALQVFEGACKQGVFRLSVSVRPADAAVEFSLPVAGACMACIGLWRLLAELRGRVQRDGPKILRNSVVVLLGDGQAAVANLATAMAQWCAVPGVPFQVDPPAGTHHVALSAPAADLAAWLLSEFSVLMCPVMPPAAELERMVEAALQQAEGAALERSRVLLLEAQEADCSGAQSLPLPYCAVRPALWQQLQSNCAQLAPLLPQLPHSALSLLDAAAAANLLDVSACQLDHDGAAPAAAGAASAVPQAHMLAACVVVAVQAAAAKGQLAAAGASLPSEQEVCGRFRLQLTELVAAAARLREACGAACRVPTSAFAVVELYLDTLLAGQVDRKVPAASLIGEASALAGHCPQLPASLGMPVAQLAGILVAAGRQARGLFPVWPKALVVLTGMLTPVGEGQQQLLQELVAHAAGSL
ncbi:hypothetical protein OEZ85_008295 [Tetradesmus obliquus]|uniref:PROP1-like PPR domain-containing protein n=1 Tax=Tetradesmus obliquus TaxID=3088 RepID=A0ABY8TIF3_TETOB|nr:hypothetical protein OEZ85_008295 [Tetradesmus obliquus]